MQFLSRQWPKHAFRFGGGGRTQQSQAIQSAPIPLPAPPVTANNTAVIQAEHDIAQANLLKKSVKNTIYAGDTGGFRPGGPLGKPPMGGPYGGKLPGPEINLGPRA